MGALADDDRVYTLDLGLDEPIPRAALIAARDAGHTVERVAVDSAQTVEHVLMRCEEEDVELGRAWKHAHSLRQTILTAARMWRQEGVSITQAASAHAISRHTLRDALVRLGYTPHTRRARSLGEASARAHALKRRPHVRRLKRLVREREGAGLSPMTLADVERALHISRPCARRVCAEAQYVPARPRGYEACVDAVTRALALPLDQRPTQQAVADQCGVKVQHVRYVVSLLGARWQSPPATKRQP